MDMRGPLNHRHLLAALVILLLAGAEAFAGGQIEGRVTRRDGSAVSGVTVVIEAAGTSTLTDPEGRFAFADVAPGTVKITFFLGTNSITTDRVVDDNRSVTVDQVVDWTVGFAETVTTYAASRRTERLIEAPASVAVVTEAAIANEAPHAQLPRVLASTAGVQLTQSGVFDFNVNIRGLNNTLNRRVLTLVDGRDPSSVLIGSQEWAAFALPLDEIARVEVVRGAGSALYGVNAFNGVINITSKEPRYAPGGRVAVSGGELGTLNLSARRAGALSGNSFYRVQTAYGRTNDFFRSRNTTVEYPGVPLEVIPLQRDSTEFVNLGGRLDRYLSLDSVVTVEGGWARSEGNILMSSAGRSQNLGVQRPWVRSVLQTSRWNVSGYYDGRRGSMASLASGAPTFDDSLKANTEVIHRRDYKSHAGRVVVGGAYRFQRADTRDTAENHTILGSVHASHEGGAFGQVDHPLGSRLRAVFAARLDASTLYQPEFSPKVALVFSTPSGHGLRFSYGRAFESGSFVHYFLRTPVRPPVPLAAVESALAPALGGTPLNLSAVPVLALGNRELEVERVQTFEGGYSGVFARRLLIGVNYYFNRISNLITPLLPQVGSELGRINPAYLPYQPPSALNTTQQALVLGALRQALPASLLALMSNDADGRPIFAAVSWTTFARVNVQGAEASAQYFLGERFMADATYAWFDFMPKGVSPDFVSGNAPPHRVTAGTTYTTGPVTAGVHARWSNAFVWNTGIFRGPVPAATVTDLTARYTVGRRTTVMLNVANLFDNDHYEIFGGDILRRRALLTLVQSW
jgi:outer membrane receptor for ferrienterochelin and colicins